MKNNVSFYEKQRVVLCKTTAHFLSTDESFFSKRSKVVMMLTQIPPPLVTLVTAKNTNSCSMRECTREKPSTNH